MLSTDQKKRILFLWLDDREFHCINAARRGVTTAKVYTSLPKWAKAVRRLMIILDWFSIGPWLEKWRRNLDEFDTVIIHASKITSPVVKYIKKKKPKLRIIVWYWNPVDKCEKLEKYPESICERWCFDEQDSQKYNLLHNTQYYFKDIQLEDIRISNDIYFLGADKGRLDDLLKIKNELNVLGCSVDFHITRGGASSDSTFDYKPRISYEENLRKISQSKSILDIVSDGQSGLTLRPLEALFFQKKLITNDKSVKERDFYHPNNIFIWNGNLTDLKEFMEEPYSVVDDSVILKYDFDFWLERFFK